MKGSKTKKAPIRNRLISSLGISDCIVSGGYLELRGRSELSIGGCKRIVKYTDEEIVLRLLDCSIMIRGRGLCCSAFYSDSVGISGYIESLCFSGSEDYERLKKGTEECKNEG